MQDKNILMFDKKASGETKRLYLQIANELADLINSGEFPLNKRLPAERELAAKFDVSRQTIREALIALEVSGLIEIKPGSGIYILKNANLKPSLIIEDAPGPLEIMEARILLESEAASLSASKMSNEELLKLEVYLNQMTHFMNLKQPEEAEKFDHKFHQLIAESTRNSAVLAMIEWLWALRDSSEISRVFTQKVRQNTLCPNVDEHKLIYQKLAQRDSEGAKLAMQRHLTNVANAYVLLSSN